MTIGRLAREVGISTSKVRYYEHQKLLPSALRSDGGYRRYDDSALKRLRLILRAKALGFSLGEIRDLFGDGGRGEAEDVVKAARHRRDLVAGDIMYRAQLMRRLNQLVDLCSLGDPSQCEDLELPDRAPVPE